MSWGFGCTMNAFKVIKRALWLVVVGVLLFVLTSCVTRVSPLSTSKQTPVSTRTFSLTPDIPASDHMAGCTGINPINLQRGQVGYRGVFPGLTTTIEVENLLGRPISDTVEFGKRVWFYEDYADIVIYFDSHNIVSHILLGIDPEKGSIMDLESVIENYGCPSAIYKFVDLDGAGFTGMVYKELGLAFRFGYPPLTLHSVSTLVLYFKPTTLDDFLYNYNWFISTDRWPISWDEMVE